MITLGIDIGTTSICVVCFDNVTEKIIHSVSVSNNFLNQGSYWQDPEKIVKKVKQLLEQVQRKNIAVGAMGITCQMHGILYVDANGKAVTPVYTWKNEYGDKMLRDGMTYAQYLEEETGYTLCSGYGVVTHYYLQTNKLIPINAYRFVSIGDYLAMTLTRTQRVKIDKTMAASFGVFSMKTEQFDNKKLIAAGVDISYFPEITQYSEVMGRWQFQNQTIPVYKAVGDNQASFFCAVKDKQNTISINVGTGAQVSLYAEQYMDTERADIRPFIEGGYLYVGASLNGGKVYETLARFFGEIGVAFTGKEENAYDVMFAMGKAQKETTLKTTPNLYGKRGVCERQSSIENITIQNFHPAHVIRSFVKGMAQELYEMYEYFPEDAKKGKKQIAASGNGIRKNHLLLEEIERIFGMPVTFSDREEEAAAGAAWYAAIEATQGEIECKL